MSLFIHRGLLMLAVSAMVWAQPGVSLKTGSKPVPGDGLGADGRGTDTTGTDTTGTKGEHGRLAQSVKRRIAGRWHMLLVFRTVPNAATRSRLEERGIQPLDVVPERGLMAVVPDSVSLDGVSLDAVSLGLDLEWSGRLSPEQKVSPLLAASGLLAGTDASKHWNVLVEFFQDVDRADAVGLVFEEGLTVIDNPDLARNQLLVRGPADRLAALPQWDEVSYLFPASQEIEEGKPVELCGGALTTAGAIAQIVAKIGEGWDGAGLGSVDLGYAFSSLTGRLTSDQVKGEFQKAFAEWSKHVKVRFQPASSITNQKTIHVLFGTGDHGDGYPFDGRGRTLAHTFYPSPPNPEPIAGDMHLDDDEPWQIGDGVDLFSVVLHELGHSLGLGHSDNPESVMYPYYRKVTALHAEDIRAIQELYAPQERSAPAPVAPLELTIAQPQQTSVVTREAQIAFSGSTSGGTGTGQVLWSASNGASGVAQGWRPWSIPVVSLPAGDTIVTITAVDGAQARVSRQVRVTREIVPVAALTVRILTPTSAASMVTNASPVTLTGTAGPAGALSRIFWSNSRGSGGAMAGSAAWTTSPIPLEPGLNRITVTVVGNDGATATAVLDLDYQPVSTTPSGPDTVAPALTILDPVSTILTTSSASLNIFGTALDAGGVTEVNWLSSSGRTGVAQGTTQWRIQELPLAIGINTLVIRAWDAAGNMSWRSLVVTRN